MPAQRVHTGPYSPPFLSSSFFCCRVCCFAVLHCSLPPKLVVLCPLAGGVYRHAGNECHRVYAGCADRQWRPVKTVSKKALMPADSWRRVRFLPGEPATHRRRLRNWYIITAFFPWPERRWEQRRRRRCGRGRWRRWGKGKGAEGGRERGEGGGRRGGRRRRRRTPTNVNFCTSLCPADV